MQKLLEERENQYKDHRLYKEAHDDLFGWLNRAREKVPSMKQRSLSDKLALEQAISCLDSLLKKQAPGELLVEHLNNTGEVVLSSTSPQGKELIKKEMEALTESFHGLFKGKLFFLSTVNIFIEIKLNLPFFLFFFFLKT